MVRTNIRVYQENHGEIACDSLFSSTSRGGCTIKKRRAGEIDMGANMETLPMDRSMLKIMNFFGVESRKKEDG